MQKSNIAVIGLGVMGRNLALNMAQHGFSVAGFDVDSEKRAAAAHSFAGKNVVAASPKELADLLERPRRILMLVPAGSPVDAVINDLKPLLSAGDLLIDGGNSFFLDTARRATDLSAQGILYLGSGISGGEEGALKGPSIMPGGREDAYRLVEPILTSIAAQVQDGPCCAYIGPDGAGHYVKMVHNGIEYAIMQLIGEVYDLLKRGLGLEADEVSRIFERWNQGELNSFLVEITALVLGKKDEETHRPLVDLILDKAGQKGTGKWTSQNALDLGVATPTINAAVEARILSAFKDERAAASTVLRGPDGRAAGNRESFLAMVHDALRLAVLTCYAQGFALMREASKEYHFGLKFNEIARIWKGGCIIRAKLLDSVQAALTSKPDAPNLLVDSHFSALVNELHPALRRATATAAQTGVPGLALGASLGYLDSYRQERLPANLLQAQRDHFGAHTYQRIDKSGTFHTDWTES